MFEQGVTHVAGSLLLFTCGEYSSYSTGMLCRVVKDFDIEHEASACKPVVIEAHLLACGFVEELEYDELNTSDFMYRGSRDSAYFSASMRKRREAFAKGNKPCSD